MEESIPNQTTNSTNPAGGNPPAPQLLSVKYLADKLEEAELLLGYAAEVGIKVDAGVRDDVLKARMASNAGGITEPTAASLLAALTTLAVNVRPVTVQSLRAWKGQDEGGGGGRARKLLLTYTSIAFFVGFIIVVFSLLTFVSKSLSDKITVDIETANGLAAKLRAELGPAAPPTNQPPTGAVLATNNAAVSPADEVWFGPGGIPAGLSDKDVLSDLQHFAATMREINGYTRQLNRCLFNFQSWTNQTLELAAGLNVRLSEELTENVQQYQRVRSYANLVVEKVTVDYGAIAVSILPLLYALLGAIAYLVRSYEEQSKNRTLLEPPVARLLIAGIGGLVVGQFNNVTQGINITPFAVAFLVGYAVDVFFTFLEGLLQMFIKRTPGNT